MHPLLTQYFSFIKKIIPSKAEGSAVGLDIGITSCKMIELIQKDGSYHILNWSIDSINDGNYTAAVQKALDQIKTVPSNLYTSICGKGTLIRFIEMPKMSVDDLKSSFAIEADKYFPFDADQIYTDCYVLNSQGNDKQMKVMAAAAKKELVDTRLTLLNNLGVQTDFIGLNPIALANVLHNLNNQEKSKEKSVVALLDMGEAVSSLTILIDNVPRFTRDIFVGGDDISKRMSNTFGIDFKEAEKIKCSPGDRKDEVIKVCESAIGNLVQELRLSFDYFTTENSEEVTRLLLTGGASLTVGIDKIISKSLGIEISQWNPFENLTVNEAVSQEELTKKANRLGL